MRTLLKVLFGFVAALVILIAAAASWFFFYSRDLPDVGRLAQLAPTAPTSVSDPCLGSPSVAIPYDSIGGNLRNALSAVEVREGDPGVLTTIYRGFALEGLPKPGLSVQISRTMLCAPSKTLSFQLNEIRTASRLERRFTQQELFTIYANRVSFGKELIGVQSASQYFFHKNPGDLDIADAALLAGLVNAPSYFSPLKHPDRALERRNRVIDAMVQAGSVTMSEANAAKAAPLGVPVDTAKPRVQ